MKPDWLPVIALCLTIAGATATGTWVISTSISGGDAVLSDEISGVKEDVASVKEDVAYIRGRLDGEPQVAEQGVE